jgi:hypothetical protein
VECYHAALSLAPDDSLTQQLLTDALADAAELQSEEDEWGAAEAAAGEDAGQDDASDSGGRRLLNSGDAMEVYEDHRAKGRSGPEDGRSEGAAEEDVDAIIAAATEAFGLAGGTR